MGVKISQGLYLHMTPAQRKKIRADIHASSGIRSQYPREQGSSPDHVVSVVGKYFTMSLKKCIRLRNIFDFEWRIGKNLDKRFSLNLLSTS